MLVHYITDYILYRLRKVTHKVVYSNDHAVHTMANLKPTAGIISKLKRQCLGFVNAKLSNSVLLLTPDCCINININCQVKNKIIPLTYNKL